jgi:hypothetical protein
LVGGRDHQCVVLLLDDLVDERDLRRPGRFRWAKVIALSFDFGASLLLLIAFGMMAIFKPDLIFGAVAASTGVNVASDVAARVETRTANAAVPWRR